MGNELCLAMLPERKAKEARVGKTANVRGRGSNNNRRQAWWSTFTYSTLLTREHLQRDGCHQRAYLRLFTLWIPSTLGTRKRCPRLVHKHSDQEHQDLTCGPEAAPSDLGYNHHLLNRSQSIGIHINKGFNLNLNHLVEPISFK